MMKLSPAIRAMVLMLAVGLVVAMSLASGWLVLTR